MKHCKKCEQDKVTSEFYAGRPECKECTLKDNARRAKQPKARANCRERQRICNDHVVRALGNESDWDEACA